MGHIRVVKLLPTIAGALALAAFAHTAAANTSCEDLGKFPLAGGNINLAVPVAGSGTIPLKVIQTSLPPTVAFCSETLQPSPTPDSVTSDDVLRPASGQWNRQ